jgi:hypothetical protein
VFIRTALRNPLDEKRMVSIALTGVPQGYRVHFPHAWVWLDPKSERQFDLVVIPFLDFGVYQERKITRIASVRITGWLPREYQELIPPYQQPPGSRYYPIGGNLNVVRVVRQVKVDLKEDREAGKEAVIMLRGKITPAFAKQRVRVDLYDPMGALRVAEIFTDLSGEFKASFDLRYEPSLEADRKKWKKAKAVLKGTYRAQARTIAASEVASAESAMVFVQR